MGKDVIEIEVHLAYDADIIAACTIDRDDGFDCQLVFVANVDQPGIDGSGGALLAVEIRNLGGKAPFDERDQMIEELRKPKSFTLDLR